MRLRRDFQDRSASASRPARWRDIAAPNNLSIVSSDLENFEPVTEGTVFKCCFFFFLRSTLQFLSLCPNKSINDLHCTSYSVNQRHTLYYTLMWRDVIDIRDFYASPLGQTAQRIIGKCLRRQWSNLTGHTVLGLGYTTPYLELFRNEGAYWKEAVV